MRKIFFSALVLLMSSNVWALTEINGEFGYQKQVYGNTKQNDVTTRTYSGAVALYFFNYTALELNFSQEENITTEHNTISITGTGYSVIGMQNKVKNYNYGVGLRQAFAGKGAWLKPTLSLGYARQFITDQSSYTFQNDASGASFESVDDPYKSRSDSVFATFGLQLALTKTMAFRFSVNTIFPAFEFDRAQDNMKYLAGFTRYL